MRGRCGRTADELIAEEPNAGETGGDDAPGGTQEASLDDDPTRKKWPKSGYGGSRKLSAYAGVDVGVYQALELPIFCSARIVYHFLAHLGLSFRTRRPAFRMGIGIAMLTWRRRICALAYAEFETRRIRTINDFDVATQRPRTFKRGRDLECGAR